jgi:hypothetical protein
VQACFQKQSKKQELLALFYIELFFFLTLEKVEKSSKMHLSAQAFSVSEGAEGCFLDLFGFFLALKVHFY